MGTGCEEVAYKSDGAAVGSWPGRVASARVGRPEEGWGVEALRSKDARRKYKIAPDYRSLLVEVVKFVETRQPPVLREETLEILSFLDAAQRSKAAGGAPVKLH